MRIFTEKQNDLGEKLYIIIIVLYDINIFKIDFRKALQKSTNRMVGKGLN